MTSSTSTKIGLKTFEIGYKGHYYEHDEWFTDYVEAENEEVALQMFSLEHSSQLECEQCGYPQDQCQSPGEQAHDPHEFKPPRIGIPYDWDWEEGGWLMVFRYIKEVKMKTCPKCRGTGRIPTDVERNQP